MSQPEPASPAASMSDDHTTHLSDQFVISCGTVTLDIRTNKVLLVRSRSTMEWMLPKGRKNVSEELEQTARRETFEETGYHCFLLPHTFGTLATSGPSRGPSSSVPVTNEPFAMTRRTTNGVLKVIFWYLAQGDSTMPRMANTQMPDEDFQSKWIHGDQVLETLTYPDDRAVAKKAIEYKMKY